MTSVDLTFFGPEAWRLGFRYLPSATEEEIGSLAAGSATEAAKELWKIVSAHNDSASKWPVHQTLIKGLAVELSIHFAREGVLPPPELLELLAWAASLPPQFLADKAAFYAGSWNGGRPVNDDRAYGRAFFLDLNFAEENGCLMPLHGLAKVLRDEGITPPSRATLRKWQAAYGPMIVAQLAPKPDPGSASTTA